MTTRAWPLATLLLLLAAGTACSGGDAAPARNGRVATVSEYATSPLAQQLTTRRVWSGSPWIDILGDPSPDGRWLSYVDWETGDLAVRDLAGGTGRRLTDKGGWEESADFAESSAFSRDGRQLAYAWYHDPTDTYQLRVLGLDGGEPRVLISGAGWTQPYDWTPDGRWILVHTWYRLESGGTLGPRAEPSGLALVAPDGEVRVLGEIDYPHEAAFSPGGRWVAYDAPGGPLKNASPRDVMVASVEGARPRLAFGGPADDRLLGWLEEPDALLVLSDRSGSPALWIQSMSGGSPAGEPELLREDIGQIENVGVSGGSFMYFVTLEPQRVVLAELDLPGGRVASPPAPVSPETMRSNNPTWSPDGRFLAYLLRPGLTERIGVLVIRGPDGRQLREMAMPLDNVTNLLWTHDPDRLIAKGRDASGEVAIYRVDLRTGGAERLAPVSGNMRQSQLSPDDRTLYFIRDDSERHGVYALDLESGRERAVHEDATGGIANMELSPDGAAVAFTSWDPGSRSYRLLVVPAAGGETRELKRVRPPRFLPGHSGMAWSPDGRYLLYVVSPDMPDAERPQELWRIDVATAEERKLLEEVRIAHLRLHSDGRRLVYTSGTNVGEVWLMEGFDGAR